ncbi:MAG TPA: YbaB/EbfC family nucleoid-associated protein [Candidatus Omnitrophota bacterium]|nr:YbaB/EbfC family nucleoid-associated protein [Candidatus Omnitrophota bacterium]HPT39978.1 YbaB/EbfC family nucleoid-associated protein [Candidatus Omnitrophota bacterium]
MFDKMKGLFEMQKKMQEVKRVLENTNFDIQSSDGLVKITMNGAQEVKAITVKDNLTEQERSRLDSALKDTFNRSIKRSQEVAASKMREVTGINLPGIA